jgi:hypothetical protein
MRLRLATLASALALLCAPAPCLAEVSVDRPVPGVVVPFFVASPTGPWAPVRAGLPAGDLLNPGGDGEGEGWPKVLVNEGNGRVEVIWSAGGEDREILRSFHGGAAWSAEENLSSQVGADHLPVAATDPAGNLFVAWERERNARQSVFFAAVSPTDGRVASVEITDRARRGRRPSLVFHDGTPWVASEEATTAADGVIRVVVDRIDVARDLQGHVVDGGEDTIDVARQVCHGTQLSETGAAVQLHSEAGWLWADWIDAAGVVGWTQRVGDDWSEPAFEAFDPPEGDAAARAAVRALVLGL